MAPRAALCLVMDFGDGSGVQMRVRHASGEVAITASHQYRRGTRWALVSGAHGDMLTGVRAKERAGDAGTEETLDGQAPRPSSKGSGAALRLPSALSPTQLPAPGAACPLLAGQRRPAGQGRVGRAEAWHLLSAREERSRPKSVS